MSLLQLDYHASALEGMTIKGEKHGDLWTIVKRLEPKPTSGGNFSVCYDVRNSSGRIAFLKASDVKLITKFSGKLTPAERLLAATSEFLFECRILDACSGNSLDKIVTALDHGSVTFEHNGIQDVVFFIIFEPAVGDVRSSAVRNAVISPAWFLKALHNVAVGVSQLHRLKIAHNDIKPSNVLVFDRTLQKLADLGRATSDDISGPWDADHCVGDLTYTPPEMWGYKFDPKRIFNKITFESRAPCDIYLLGSLMVFFLAGEALTPILRSFLQPHHRAENWNEDYEAVLPYILTAHDEAMQLLRKTIESDWDQKYHVYLLDLLPLIAGLTCPDPRRRGDPITIKSNTDKYSMVRIVSILDRLSKQLVSI